MKIRKIKKLIALIEKSDIFKFEISKGKKTLRINRISSNSKILLSNNHSLKINEDKDISNSIEINSKTRTPITKSATEHKVRSPIVGTFYRAPNPEAEPFIEIGQNVNVGDPICIIEAMKMMNKIESDKTGTVKAILLENGDTVEYNEPIIIIE
ncbi:Biotin carboxyl carrier protein of acetyl-CoA carboxylase [Candidatus Providencia siddallii]|uniref:Biotin carboxyl carrier protein of acetyl-CoA carboxylase n=1 Tax=Candidatus Providencia siddallii TaxID=1715285 RepID=A0A0M6W757_9GAMM|nr:Biotin carboxyl carrier protein of acetyl-CoA carboxylase [Candidatus Providencia siddallii]